MKLADLARTFKRELAFYRAVAAHSGTPKSAKWLLGAAIGYALLPGIARHSDSYCLFHNVLFRFGRINALTSPGVLAIILQAPETGSQVK